VTKSHCYTQLSLNLSLSSHHAVSSHHARTIIYNHFLDVIHVNLTYSPFPFVSKYTVQKLLLFVYVAVIVTFIIIANNGRERTMMMTTTTE